MGPNPASTAAPFAHRRAEHGSQRVRRLLTLAAVQLIQAAAGPEAILEPIRRLVDAPHGNDLLKHHCPDPNTGEQQADHHRLHDPIRLQEQAPKRQILGRLPKRLSGHATIHATSPSPARDD